MARVRYSEHCAWRAVYVDDPPTGRRAYLGLDPIDGRGPQVFGGYWWARDRQGGFRVTIPHLSWRTYRWRRIPGVMQCYQAQEWARHRLDGRYRRTN
jgi:hypothetical protein